MTRPIYFISSLLILICLIALFSGLAYRFYSLNNLTVAVSLILAVIFFTGLQYYYLISSKKTRPPRPEKEKKTKFKLINFLLLASYLLLFLACIYLLIRHRTASAIISPWHAVPPYFFALYGLATFILIGNLIKNAKISLALITLHYLLSFSAALIVYRLGYGFDPFIHQATEKLIDLTGAAEPKPYYYLGQYGLIISLRKLTSLPVVWLDRILVPALASLFLPAALWRVLKSWFPDERLNLILILSLLALTFPFLIVTTPQNLAYILLLLAILLGLICKSFYDFLIILLLASTAAITQPVAGLPALLFCGLLAVYHSDKASLKKYLYPPLLLTAVFILPVLFYFLEKKLPPAAAGDLLAPTSGPAWLNSADRENFILNFIYLYAFNFKVILLLLIAYGARLAWKFRAHCRVLAVYSAEAAALFASYFLAKKIPFVFLISYERDDYAARILFTALLFLLPIFIIAIYSLMEKIIKQNIFIKLSFAVLLTLLVSSALYLSYPRGDNYFNSRGYSVSDSDLEAVAWINQDAGGDYIVLANQQVSAAALNRFGFKKYYQTPAGPIFYYPIPTGSPLYQYYLDMVYKQPDRATMIRAMDSVKAGQGYFVLNKYWWAYDKILAEAKLSASSYKSFAGGEVYVFKYEK